MPNASRLRERVGSYFLAEYMLQCMDRPIDFTECDELPVTHKKKAEELIEKVQLDKIDGMTEQEVVDQLLSLCTSHTLACLDREVLSYRRPSHHLKKHELHSIKLPSRSYDALTAYCRENDCDPHQAIMSFLSGAGSAAPVTAPQHHLTETEEKIAAKVVHEIDKRFGDRLAQFEFTMSEIEKEGDLF